MSREEAKRAIEDVLQRYAELQINLASESARTEIAAAILREVEDCVPGMMSLSELVSLPPSHQR